MSAAQLVELEESPQRLGHPHPHPLPAGRVPVNVSVFDRVVEDRCQAVDGLADRRGSERDAAPVVIVADIRAGGEVGAQVARLAHLLGLEVEAEIGVDRIETMRSEERQQVAAEQPEVVVAGVLGERSIAEDAVGASLQPERCVLVEGGHRARLRGRRLLGWRVAAPDSGTHARQDVAQLASRRAFGPSAAAAALAVGALVKRDALAPTVGAEAQLELQCAVGASACSQAS